MITIIITQIFLNIKSKSVQPGEYFVFRVVLFMYNSNQNILNYLITYKYIQRA